VRSGRPCALANSEKKGLIYDVIMHICDVSGGRSIPRGRELIAQRLTRGLFCKSQGSSPPALTNWGGGAPALPHGTSQGARISLYYSMREEPLGCR
jgi:hypothetical protein